MAAYSFARLGSSANATIMWKLSCRLEGSLPNPTEPHWASAKLYLQLVQGELTGLGLTAELFRGGMMDWKDCPEEQVMGA